MYRKYNKQRYTLIYTIGNMYMVQGIPHCNIISIYSKNMWNSNFEKEKF